MEYAELQVQKRENLTKEEQLEAIRRVEERSVKFFTKDFDTSCFTDYNDNFKLKEHIESVLIMKQDLKTKPKFSIAIPNYKRKDELKRALDSVLNQDFESEYEVLVVENTDNFNDNSIGEMLEKEYKGRINYYRNKENLGLFGNWNRCITLAQGEWVGTCHSDDMLMPNYLKELSKVIKLKKCENVALLGVCSEGETHHFKKKHEIIRKVFKDAYMDRALSKWTWWSTNVSTANTNGGGGG
ncbi:glycosyltransferase [Helicobacter saguini]|uniref:Glycosyltransferase family 2 protein n=2 Tax=Helicobacter saguini TaxID=1548018 RepID=A0A4U8T1G0_9HELI|nr:glycosyltransferase family 2 protein [Helicobacter saguini]MWV67513.1 glycosyltransferase [Helicobacter saguini]TLD93270.1 glycosyltransferase family 2 protein [Helicobacter saguini]